VSVVTVLDRCYNLVFNCIDVLDSIRFDAALNVLIIFNFVRVVSASELFFLCLQQQAFVLFRQIVVAFTLHLILAMQMLKSAFILTNSLFNFILLCFRSLHHVLFSLLQCFYLRMQVIHLLNNCVLMIGQSDVVILSFLYHSTYTFKSPSTCFFIF